MFRIDELSLHLGGEGDRKPPGDGNTEEPGGSTSRVKSQLLCSCAPPMTTDCEGAGKGEEGEKAVEDQGLLLRQLRRELGEIHP